ncbi:HAD family hydrolase [Actinomadura sp. 1N219]|uniref:HAD family hydrolase n=1 Tax=Actinomadura sp. 1N219 TaxID=3375152 RepID=UPI00378D673B
MPLNPPPLRPPPLIEAVICDYGGVLTNPLAETLQIFADTVGLEPEVLTSALAAAAHRYGISPMAAMETGAITEEEFVEWVFSRLPGENAGDLLGGKTFGELWFAGRRANAPFVEFLRGLRRDGHRLALLTNNVKEWEPLWRATLPVEELFELVVNSADEGVRKPDPEIYERTVERLGVAADRCLLIDDLEVNCAAAERLGMFTVRFADAGQAAAEVREWLS